MAKREIRTQYSGFIFFAAKLLTVVTGIGFTLMITWSITKEENGIWGTLNIIMPYFTLMSTALPFWIMRFVARDKEGATKTGILANTAIGTIATLIYFALLPLIIPAFGLENYIIFFVVAATQIIEVYLIAVLEGCLQAQRPHYVGYGLLVGEICKLLFAYVFVMALGLSLLGIALSIAAAFAIKIAFYFRTIFRELQSKITLGYVREWLSGSAFNIYNIAGDRIAAIIFLMIPAFGTEIAASYYQVSAPIANVITYSSFLAFALYPKILAENKLQEATTSLKMVLMFSIPMTAGVLAIPSAYLLILPATYVEATPVLMILAIDALILTLSSVFGSVLFGIEKIDEKAKIPFREVMRTRLFIAFSLPYVHSLISLPTAFYVLTYFAGGQPVLVAAYALGINTTVKFAMFLVQYVIVSRAVKIEIPWRNIAKYVFASIFIGMMLYVIHPTGTYKTLAVTALGGLAYVALLIAIDRDTRKLLKAILQEMRKNRAVS